MTLEQWQQQHAPGSAPGFNPVPGATPQLPGERPSPALEPYLAQGTGEIHVGPRYGIPLGVEAPFFAPQEPESLAQSIKTYIEKAHLLYRQTWDSHPDIKAFWAMKPAQQFVVLRKAFATPEQVDALAHIDAPETKKRLQRYAALVQEFGS